MVLFASVHARSWSATMCRLSKCICRRCIRAQHQVLQVVKHTQSVPLHPPGQQNTAFYSVSSFWSPHHLCMLLLDCSLATYLLQGSPQSSAAMPRSSSTWDDEDPQQVIVSVSQQSKQLEMLLLGHCNLLPPSISLELALLPRVS